MASGKFHFNLLPPKTREQVKIERERDDSALYSMILVFIAALIYFILYTVDATIVTPRVETLEDLVIARQATIATYDVLKRSNGELYVKARSLEQVLSRKVDAEKIFSIGSALTAGISGTQIVEYGRERTGEFLFTMESPRYEDVPLMLANSEEIEGISNVLVKQSIWQEDVSNVRTTISLVLDASPAGE